MTFHSGGYPSSPAGAAASPRSLGGFVLPRMDHLIAVNQDILRLFHRFGVPDQQASLISPAADLGPVGDDVPMPPGLTLFLSKHSVLLLTVGLLEPEYRVALQIDALSRIREQVPNAGLVIVGSGSLAEELAAHIGQSPAADHLFLAGDLPHAITLRLIARADVLLRTTAFDGDSLSVREALRTGTRVLASDNGMRPSGVHLMRGDGPEALSRNILEILALPRIELTPAAPDTANLARILEVYQTLRPELQRQPP